MESVGWLDKEPNLKPKSNESPNGFDYENLIGVLDTNTFTPNGSGILEIETNYNSAEAEHIENWKTQI